MATAKKIANTEARLEEALQRHDWYYAFRDIQDFVEGHSHYRLTVLPLLKQADLDTAKALWAKYAPPSFKFPV